MVFEYKKYTEAQKEEVIDEMISKVNHEAVKKCAYLNVHKGVKYDELNQELVEKYIREWAEAKWKFYVMFGHKFCVSKSVQYQADERKTYENFRDIAEGFPKYAIQLKSFAALDVANNMLLHPPLWCEQFCNNVYNKKLTKAISQIFNDPVLDMAISKVYQNTLVETDVFISCHIMEYLTTSLNKHKWGSCYNITNGCYSVGPWVLMRDDCTLVGFTKGDKDVTYNNGANFHPKTESAVEIVWNNKQSRSHILFNEKGYTVCRPQGNPSEWFVGTLKEIMNEQVFKEEMFVCHSDYSEGSHSHVHDDMVESYGIKEDVLLNHDIGKAYLTGVISGRTVNNNYSLF